MHPNLREVVDMVAPSPLDLSLAIKESGHQPCQLQVMEHLGFLNPATVPQLSPNVQVTEHQSPPSLSRAAMVDQDLVTVHHSPTRLPVVDMDHPHPIQPQVAHLKADISVQPVLTTLPSHQRIFLPQVDTDHRHLLN